MAGMAQGFPDDGFPVFAFRLCAVSPRTKKISRFARNDDGKVEMTMAECGPAKPSCHRQRFHGGSMDALIFALLSSSDFSPIV